MRWLGCQELGEQLLQGELHFAQAVEARAED